MTPAERRARWLAYLAGRTGTYEWRCLRYAAAWDRLEAMGLANHDLVVDVGAGMCDLDRYARTVRAFDGRYLPVDGSIDGTELNTWYPRFDAEFFVALELVEHLRDPMRLLHNLEARATKGVVITTPNPAVVDVLAIDDTHLSSVTREMLNGRGYHVSEAPLFGKDGDTLVAWKRRKTDYDDYLSPSQRIVRGLDR